MADLADNTARLLRELELQRTHMKRVAHLGVVERGEAELIVAVEIVELHIGLAAGHELARYDRGPLAVVPLDRRRNVAAVAGKWRDHDRCHFVARLEFAVIEGSLVLLLQIIGAALVCRRTVLVHERACR